MAVTELGHDEVEPQATRRLTVVGEARPARVTYADVVANQMRMPRGLLAPLAARSLNRRNQGLIERTIAALDVMPGHRVLDVGFGGGVSLGLLLDRVGDGAVAGLEPSPEMVTRACRLYAGPLRDGRLSVSTGAIEGGGAFGDATFDRVLTCQTIYFWSDIAAGLAELHRVLIPGGRVAVAMMPKVLQQRFGFVARGYTVISHDEVMAALEETGFTQVHPWPPHAPDPRWIIVAQRS